MIGLIKADSVESVDQASAAQLRMGLQSGHHSARAADVRPADATETQLRESVTRIAELERALQDSEGRIELTARDAYSQGYEAGVIKGRLQAEADEVGRSAALRAGIGVAVDSLRDELSADRLIIINIVEACLAQVFGLPSLRKNAIEKVIKHYLAGVEATTVLRIRVSDEDFDSVDHLKADLSETACTIEVLLDRSLSTGDCVIDVQLGEVAIGLEQQHSSLRCLLEEILI